MSEFSWSEQQFDDACRRVRPTLIRWVRRRVRCDDHCDEVVQRVFYALAKNRDNFGPASMEAYAMRASANAVKNYYERDLPRWSSRISLENWAEDYGVQRQSGEPCPDQGIGMRDLAVKMFDEMKTCCSPIERSIAMLFFQGASFDEISKDIHMNAVTVRSHFKRAREKLLQHLWLNSPDLLGGQDQVLAVLDTLVLRGELSDHEAEAVRERKGGALRLRAALLKVATHLTALLFALPLMGGRS
ncbi:MAG: sigma-70 family RNA polymerase sigma factor [Armatimonadetes bacterium]|nr:sigma-70 family RNA polymerase sigma factor [Armatimonadota bacterium]